MRKLILALAVTMPALVGVTMADAATLSLPAPAAPRNYTPIPAQYRPPTTCTTSCSPIFHTCTTTCR